MSDFLHKLAEGLRSREKYLEDHDDHPAFNEADGLLFRKEYNALLTELRAFNKKIESLYDAKDDFDDYFEDQIEKAGEKLSAKIDTWFKKLHDLD